MTVAAKGYFDALVKLGELASDSQSSKELGKESKVFPREGREKRGNSIERRGQSTEKKTRMR